MTDATVEPQGIRLEDYEGKRVTVVRLLPEPNEQGHSVEEVTGVVEQARSGLGIILKPKGRASVELISEKEIDNIVEASAPARKLKSRRLDPVEAGKVKSHLAQAHGTSLTWINQATASQAEQYHKELDHSDLGHHHAEKEKSDREKAIEAASQ
jgi:hypothetical protein